MTLNWDGLNGLGAYRITEIPRQSGDATDEIQDVGRRQRIAALSAAFHSAAGRDERAANDTIAFGWIRHCEGGPVQLVAAGDPIVGDETGQQAFLTLPPAATAQPLKPGTLAKLMSQLGSWRAITGIADGLIAP